MLKAAPAQLPFEKSTPLDHDSPALSTDIYRDAHSPLHDTEMVTCPPRIICSPKRTGKTTLVQYIYHKQKNISELLDEESCRLILLDEIEEGASESVLRDTVADRLAAPVACDTLAEMMGSSEIINTSTKDRVVLAIPDADNLSAAALNWLLCNVRELVLDPIISSSLRCQVVIDGSFALENITTIDSEFLLPQVFPRDFIKNEQRAFVSSGLSTLNARLSPQGHNALWENTRGDKYLTQAICLNLLDGLDTARAKLKFNENDIYSSVEGFLHSDPNHDPLKHDWITSFAELSAHFETNEFELASLLKCQPEQWELQSETIQMLAYQGGIVRRVSPAALETRPFVLDTFEQVKNRVMECREIINSVFSLEGVSESCTSDAEELIQSIMDAAYFDRLRTLHVGEGVKVNDKLISVEAVALGQGTYRGEWEISTDSSIRTGEPLWAILWSRQDAPGKRTGEIRTFAVRHLQSE